MNKKDPPAAAAAILAGDLEEVERLLEAGELQVRKGKTVCLKTNIPRTYTMSGKEHTIYVDAYSFALSEKQFEIAKLLIRRGAVDLSPGADTPYMALRSGGLELFAYAIDHGAQIGESERDITRLMLNLMDHWDSACLPIIERLHLPIGEQGGKSLCYAAGDGHRAAAEYLLSAGVDVNCREPTFQNTPLHTAAENGRMEMVRLLVERGADLSLKNTLGLRPSVAARAAGHQEIGDYLAKREDPELHSEDAQDALFQRYRVPKAMQDYLKTGELRLEFPEEDEDGLHWIKLYSYMDVPEMTYQGCSGLSLVEGSEDYEVLLMWEPKSKKIWFVDMEHDVFQPVCTWAKFIKDPGFYVNRAVMWEFDE